MNRTIAGFCLFAGIGAAFFLPPSHPAFAGDDAMLEEGDEAPAFEMPASDGETYKLDDFNDKQVVVLAWFPKAFTRGCTAECKSLGESGDAIRAFDVAYFTASCDTPEENKKFAESLELDFPILSDPDKQVASAYGVLNAERGLPFRWTYYIGKDGKILYIDKEVKPATAGEDIARRLKELGVDERKEEKPDR